MPQSSPRLTGAPDCPVQPAAPNHNPVPVNDHHSRLNTTQVRRVEHPVSLQALIDVVRRADAHGEPLCIAGGRHAMGGQQFAADAVLVDMTAMDRVLAFDRDKGQIEVEAGICWPQLLAWLARAQQGTWPQWGIRQKQTGADRLSIGGTLSANAHGRGLTMKPFIDDVESFTLLGADGQFRTCSRSRNSELFALAIGGYGLFGIITTVTLRLMRREKMQRLVSVIDVAELIPAVEDRVAAGCLYGDFQFAIDPMSDDFLRNGVFSCYQPIQDNAVMPQGQKELHAEDWLHLLYLAHVDKSRAFESYSRYYLSTHGQRYWSDSHQLSEYLDDYHQQLDARLGPSGCGTEMISELYVPRHRLVSFMEDVRGSLRRANANVVYGTIRFIEQDKESFLPWARAPYACIIFNLHTAHTHAALEKTAVDFRGLIDRAIQHGGSYYLTYHRWASRSQVQSCYPEFTRFLERKIQYDPGERFQSEWYRHYRNHADGATMKGTVSNSSSGNWRRQLSNTVFWILLFRGFLVIGLGAGLLVNPTKTEALLLNFMGVFWLISGVTLFFRADMALGKRMSLTMGLIGTLTGLIVVGRNIIGTWLTNVLLFELLGAVILLTGVAHILHEIKSRVRTPRRQSSYHFLLGVFECTMGAMLLMSALERGPHIYWPATIWALVGGALILSQALYLRAQRHIQ